MRRAGPNPDATALADLDLAHWIRPGDFIVWGQGTAEPRALTRLIREQCARLRPLRAFIGMGFAHTFEGGAPDGLALESYCATGDNRTLVEQGQIDIWPGVYSELSHYLEERVDVLMLSVSPPSEGGAMSLGLAYEYLVPLIDRARVVIAEVNEANPFTFGARALHPEECNAIVTSSDGLPVCAARRPSAAEVTIAERVATLVEDGATLQVGIGGLPDAVLAALGDRRDLGLHSGMVSDGCMSLVETGALTNAMKPVDAGVSVAGMALGSERFCRFLHANRKFSFRSTSETHDLARIAAHDRFVAVNAALEVDLTGQINAEAVGGRYVGAVGGAGEFLRGAARSKGGLPIVALPSTAGVDDKAVTRIVHRLNGPVTTPRCDAGIIITEHGIADLRGLTLRARRDRMLAIAAPQFRQALDSARDTVLDSQG